MECSIQLHLIVLYSVSSLHDTNAEKNLLRVTHQKILEEEHEREDHPVDVLPICHCIVSIGREVLVRGKYQESTLERITLHAILVKAQHAMQYRRQRRKKVVRYT